ncbi:M56 family metallopeptidase [Pleionea sp. CnH1-48]|uniref:M56 family metallopeptidase n=1 Tax=Pleionea sp. CnH1-48 TaxID=2954494 RepID=UPI0020984FB5|nr:M56 family metallopeptidase [Pleionea sp. CnH1-48]MCO7227485.1 M56 family metallopeptidase [Pleionea sp. CnH1-48]
MLEYLLINSLISLLVILALSFLHNAPARFRLRVILIGISSWLVPWHLVSLPVDASFANGQGIVVWESFVSVSSAVAQTDQSLGWEFHWVVIASLAVGCVLLLRHFGRHQIVMKQLSSRVKGKSEEFADNDLLSVPVLVVADYSNAFVRGYFKPEIWIGESLLKQPASQAIVLHELTHIKQKDNFIQLYTVMVRYLFWWNPVIYWFYRQTCELIELSCDESCQHKDENYQHHLAQLLVVHHAQREAPKFATPFFLRKKFNLYRIQQLNEEFRMTLKHILAMAISAILSISVITVSAQDTTAQISSKVTRLIFNTITKTGESENRREIGTEFSGAEEQLEELFALAKELPVTLDVSEDRFNKTLVTITSQEQAVTERMLAVFDGTEIGLMLRKQPDFRTNSASVPLKVKISVSIDKKSPTDLSADANTNEWTVIEKAPYQVQVKPQIVVIEGEERVLLDTVVATQKDGKENIIATPRMIVDFGKAGMIEIGEESAEGVFSGISMSMVASKN